MPGAKEAGSEMLSDASVDHGSNDGVENESRGSEKRLDAENVERSHGDSAPEDGCLPSTNPMASYSDAARVASSIHDTRGTSVGTPLGNVVCLMENAADAL